MDARATNGFEGPLVKRLIELGIRDPRVLAAFARVPRERFVPEPSRPDAADDRALDIGCGQTISQPYVVARMTEVLELTGTERVLEVGAGSGYQTAVLAELLPPPNVVMSIEIVPELALCARRVLRDLGYANFDLIVADGALGWEGAGPFDAILVAAAPLEVPQPLLDQLAIGGRLVIPVGPVGGNQELELWRRSSEKIFERTTLFSVRFVPLIGESRS